MYDKIGVTSEVVNFLFDPEHRDALVAGLLLPFLSPEVDCRRAEATRDPRIRLMPALPDHGQSVSLSRGYTLFSQEARTFQLLLMVPVDTLLQHMRPGDETQPFTRSLRARDLRALDLGLAQAARALARRTAVGIDGELCTWIGALQATKAPSDSFTDPYAGEEQPGGKSRAAS